MNPRNLPSIDTEADERSVRAVAHVSPNDSSDSASDLAGLGESRGAGADAGVEAADVGENRVFTLGRKQSGNADGDEDQDLALMDPPDQPAPLQADGLQDEDDDVPGVGPAGEWVTTKGRSTQSKDSKEKS